jgi:hypothetical protein
VKLSLWHISATKLNDFSTGFVYFTDKTLNILTYSFAGTVLANIIEKCKGWVNDFLALGSLGRKGFDSVTPYMHVYTMFRFSPKSMENFYVSVGRA